MLYFIKIYGSPAAEANLHNLKTTPFDSQEQSSVILCTEILCYRITGIAPGNPSKKELLSMKKIWSWKKGLIELQGIKQKLMIFWIHQNLQGHCKVYKYIWESNAVYLFCCYWDSFIFIFLYCFCQVKWFGWPPSFTLFASCLFLHNFHQHQNI